MKPAYLTAFVLLSLSGCKKTVDNKGFEKTLDERVRALGLVPGPISCPSDVEAKQGAVFTCKVPIEQAAYDLVVTITKVDGAKVEMDTKWAKGVAVMPQKIARIAPALLEKALGAKVTIDCGTEPLLFLDDGKAKCKLASGKASSVLLLTFDDKLDVKGWELVPPLLGRKELEKILQPSVAEKTSPNVKVDCGPDDLLQRPADGNVWCSITDGGQNAKIRVTVAPDLHLEKWETATPPEK